MTKVTECTHCPCLDGWVDMRKCKFQFLTDWYREAGKTTDENYKPYFFGSKNCGLETITFKGDVTNHEPTTREVED